MNKKILLILFSIFLPLLIVLFSYKAVLFFSSLEDNQQQTVDFLQGERLLLNYTVSEESHLEDVKGVMKFGDYLFYLSLLIVTLILTYHRKKKEEVKKLFFYGGITTIAFLLLMLIFSIINFDVVFTYFHQIFFPQGNWMFPSDSLLIQTFPREFFVSFSQMIFRVSLILSGVILFLGMKKKKH
tara:strand:- start:1322 stop:1873 length:552 start_codon:yes stop_codon:yes gene_type:complete